MCPPPVHPLLFPLARVTRPRRAAGPFRSVATSSAANASLFFRLGKKGRAQGAADRGAHPPPAHASALLGAPLPTTCSASTFCWTTLVRVLSVQERDVVGPGLHFCIIFDGCRKMRALFDVCLHAALDVSSVEGALVLVRQFTARKVQGG